MTRKTIDEALAPMLADGFEHWEHEHLKPGVRVRNRGEQYDAARQFGSASVVAVLRKRGQWEKDWGRKNIEVLVEIDPDSPLLFGENDNRLHWWADYGTFLTEGCWLCSGVGCERCAHVHTADQGPRQDAGGSL